jgi:anti-anti-sigma factor
MEIEWSDEGRIRTLRLTGNFDTTDVESFVAHIEEAADHQCFRVLLDTEGLKFINSTALGSLIKAQKRLQEFGGDLSVCTLPGFVGGVFRTLGLDRKIRCFKTPEEAIEYLQSVGGERVSVPGDEALEFVFVDEAQLAVAGEDPNTATLRTIDEQSAMFLWPNDRGLDAAAVMASGVRLHARFRIPLFHPTHVFDARAVVESTRSGTDGDLLVTVGLSELSDVERRGIRQFVQDMRLLGGDEE